MDTVKLLYWISLALLFYCYIGYGILVFIINVVRGAFIPSKNAPTAADVLPVTLIVTAYNEEEIIVDKIRNTLDIDYPADKLQLIFVTDGSLDDSNQLIKRYARIQLLHEPQRKGKYAAIKRALQFVENPIVVFSDANTMLNRECLQ
ncbi:MAG: glycosyltransferase, partial [Chitinophagaceae bacterium]|nr:glycosyltransferase [Chitinophagaceae bacterium]